ncbi:MAG: 4Fe-4S binding protein [Deltaproteobacteria bacterium]|jgi:polyferredoxin|nr:4Fe-4S binding protein [Deltaproteobacteria bacterium]
MRFFLARNIIQHLSFLVLTYGGRLGLSLGQSLPCLACPYVPGCGGICYIRLLQSPMAGMGLSLPMLMSWRGLEALAGFFIFVLLVIPLGKSWCGWICPFGLLQDYLGRFRKFLGIREAQLGPKARRNLNILKYLIFGYLLATPVMITLGLVHPDLTLPFCAICPVKIIMPLFALDTTWLNIDSTNHVLFSLSVILVVLSGLTLIGCFLRDRLFCLVCPMSVAIHLLKPLYLLRLIKEPKACLGCGTCRRVCPVGMTTSYQERTKADIQDCGCQGCLTCAESCASDSSLSIKFGPWTVFSSSRKNSAHSDLKGWLKFLKSSRRASE